MRRFSSEQQCFITKQSGEGYLIETDKGYIKAKNIVLATHTPKGVLPVQTFVYPYSEYGVAAKVAKPLANGIYWGVVDDPKKYSVRPYKHNGEDYMMVIGENHKTGHKEDNEENFSKLENFLREKFGVTEIRLSLGRTTL